MRLADGNLGEAQGSGPPRGPRPGFLLLAALLLAGLGLLLVALGVASWGAGGLLPFGPVGCALLALWAALVFAGSRALAPLGFDEPLVAGIVAGAAIGHLPEGLVAGLTLQVIWPGLVPMGGSREPAAGLAAIVVTVWLALLPVALDAWRLPYALGAGLAASVWAVAMEGTLRQRNQRRLDRVLWGPRETWSRGAMKVSGAGVAESALSGLAAALLLAGVPCLIVLVAAQMSGSWLWASGSAEADAVSPWRTPLPVWGISPLLCFALGGQARNAFPAWRKRPGDGNPAPHAGSRGAETAAPRLGLERLWNLLTIQAGFSDRHLQRAGFLALLGRSRPEMSGARASLAQAMVDGRPPNTHPVMAAALVGALERALCEAVVGETPRPPARLLELGETQLAQWGDRAIWGAARPAWAMMALIATALVGPAAVVFFAAGAFLASLGARSVLYRWGWSAGWNLVRGGTGRFWRRGPSWADRAKLPLVTGLVGVTVGVWLSNGPSTAASGLRAVWFILGVLLGASARRSAAWGWVCWIAAAVGTALDLWRSQNGF